MATTALIQARMGSTRLPGKVLMDLAGRPVLEHVVARVQACRRIDEVVVATSISERDIPIVVWCSTHGVRVFCGSEHDVLDRFYQAARLLAADAIVRITADCPLIDPEVIDLVVHEFAEQQADYANNCEHESWPDGLDVEVFRFSALEAAWKHAALPSEREHVTPYIRNHPERFAIKVVDHTPSLKGMRWTLDQQEDYDLISRIYAALGGRATIFKMDEVLEFLRQNPELQEINGSIVRNEGYLNSLKADMDIHERKGRRTGQELYRKAKTLIPGGTQLLSKRPEMFLPDLWPAYYASAKGCQVVDLDGNAYQDLSYMGVGACILGYADDDVNDAVIDVVKNGSMTTLNAPEEVELAELLIGVHPWAEMVRYARTGGEAVAMAVRIARAATLRDRILFCGYHGWHDWYLAANLADDAALDGHLLPGLSPSGVPRHLRHSSYPFNYNNTAEFLKLASDHAGQVAAVVMEPIRNFEPEPGFFTTIRRVCSEQGIALIVDEVSAGFRLNVGGAHLLLGLEPDIAVFAKGISNGFPMAVVLGRKHFMEAAQGSFISSTYWTERIGPAAALATMRKMIAKKVPEHLDGMGRKVQRGWTERGQQAGLHLHVGGLPPLSHFSFDRVRDPLACKTLFTQEMLKRGFLATTACYLSLAHTEVIVDGYLAACEEVFHLIAGAESGAGANSMLEGPVCHSGFKRLS